jgi:hypothetical protein
MFERQFVTFKRCAHITRLFQHDAHIHQQLCVGGCQMQCFAIDMQSLLLPAQIGEHGALGTPGPDMTRLYRECTFQCLQ